MLFFNISFLIGQQQYTNFSFIWVKYIPRGFWNDLKLKYRVKFEHFRSKMIKNVICPKFFENLEPLFGVFYNLCWWSQLDKSILPNVYKRILRLKSKFKICIFTIANYCPPIFTNIDILTYYNMILIKSKK